MSLLGGVLAIALVALEIGGITYRMDCLEADGRVSKEWTVQWFIPIPYLLPPERSGCVARSGTGVVLSDIFGIWRYDDARSELLRGG